MDEVDCEPLNSVISRGRGDSCDDGNPNTIDDIIRDDCVCRGKNMSRGLQTTNCPDIAASDINDIVVEANTVFAQVGITLINKGLGGNQIVNYDANNDNKLTKGKPPGLPNQNELDAIRNAAFSVNRPFDFVEVYFVPQLNTFDDNGDEGTSVGRATLFGGNALALATRVGDENRENEEIGSTLAHEIGHAVFDLLHPRDEYDGLTDKNNFMFHTASGRVMKFRFRQSKKIREERDVLK